MNQSMLQLASAVLYRAFAPDLVMLFCNEAVIACLIGSAENNDDGALGPFSASEMSYIVSGGALNSTHSLTHSLGPFRSSSSDP